MSENYRICRGGGATLVEIWVGGSSDSWSPEPAAPATAWWVRYSPEEEAADGWCKSDNPDSVISCIPSEWTWCSPLARSGGSLDSREHGEIFRGHFPKANRLETLRWTGSPPSYDRAEVKRLTFSVRPVRGQGRGDLSPLAGHSLLPTIAHPFPHCRG